MGAVAFRGVEGEGVGRRFTERKSAFLVHQMLGEMADRVLGHIVHRHRAFSQGKCRGDGSAGAHRVGFGRLEPIHDQFDKMCLVPVQGIDFPKFADLRVHSHLGVSLLPQLLEELLVRAFAAPDQRCEQKAAPALVSFCYQVHYLIVGISYHLPACHRGIGRGHPGEEQAQEVGDFGDGANGGAGVVARGLLFYGYNRTEPGNTLYLRLFHNAHKVLGVRGKGVHIPALPLGKNGIEGKGGLAASAQAGNHCQFASGNVHIHILEVVGVGTPDLYEFFILHHPAKMHKIYGIAINLVSLTPDFLTRRNDVAHTYRMFRCSAGTV